MAMWPFLLLLLSSAVSGYTLIETYQLFAILQTPSAPVHLLEVGGLNEEESSMLPRIPMAKYISLKDLSDLSSWPLVKTPRQEDFVVRMKAFGVKLDNTPVVLYDRYGVLFAAKAWWVFTVFGRDFVTVLNGGLPKWIREGYITSLPEPHVFLDPLTQNPLEYAYLLDPKRMWTIRDLTMLSSTLIHPEPVQLLDVRSKAEFDASSVKGSLNMPIDIVRRADGTLRSAIELNVIFQMYSVRVSNDTLTVVMGLNGIDSSMALLSLAVIGNDHSAMVDGGWMEYSQWLRNNGTQGSYLRLDFVRDTEGERQGGVVGWIWCALGAAGVLVGWKMCGTSKKRRPVQPFFSEKWL